MLHWLPALLLAAHLLYFLYLPSLPGRVVSGVGCLVALVLLLAPVVSREFGDGARRELEVMRGLGAWVVLACLGLPVLSFVAQPTLAFVRLDGRALVILSWLIALAWLLVARHAEGESVQPPSPCRRLPPVTQLFILWSALFWLMVIWDLGVGRAVAAVNHEDRLTMSFALWESRPAREHLFLIWLNPESFAQRVAYTNHLHPIAFYWYACSKLVQIATGLPLYMGRNLTPIATAAVGVLAFATLVPRLPSRARYGPRFHATLFLALGFFLSEWHFWVYPYTSNFDTVFPLIAFLAAIVWASAQPRVSAKNAGRLTAALVAGAAFGWVYTPLLIAGLWCLFGRARQGVSATLAANRLLVRASMTAAAVGVAAYVLPLLLVAFAGYESRTSPWLFRSGLDGDTRYFQNAAQAVLHPFAPSRTWWSLLLPAFVPLIAAGVCAWRSGGIVKRRFGRQAVFFLAPYLFSLALFPQSVSIHPYLYDALLIMPVTLMGSAWMLSRCVQDRLRGAAVLAALLLTAVLIMSNLIGIAQGMLRVGPR